MRGASVVERIDPHSHLISSQPWKPSGATGLYLYWQHETTGSITRWQYDYAQGSRQSVADYHLGDRKRIEGPVMAR
ncbi:MAG: hypothetical protein L0Z62_38690 [Gemmataceae bacterium]|nr:hypothetical protein [Gemmataceae bacterium]